MKLKKLAPKQAHLLVHKLFDEMYEKQMSIATMSHLSGVSATALTDWRSRTYPNVPNLEACFAVLGYQLTVVPVAKKTE